MVFYVLFITRVASYVKCTLQVHIKYSTYIQTCVKDLTKKKIVEVNANKKRNLGQIDCACSAVRYFIRVYIAFKKNHMFLGTDKIVISMAGTRSLCEYYNKFPIILISINISTSAYLECGTCKRNLLKALLYFRYNVF